MRTDEELEAALEETFSWRREQMVLAGLDMERAARLALDSAVDLHKACDLIRAAGADLAYSILS